MHLVKYNINFHPQPLVRNKGITLSQEGEMKMERRDIFFHGHLGMELYWRSMFFIVDTSRASIIIQIPDSGYVQVEPFEDHLITFNIYS
jgi:hypothetical protein